MIPKTPANNPAFRVFFKSLMFVSNPTMNNKKITPMNAISLNSGVPKFIVNVNNDDPNTLNDIPESDPIKHGPNTIPARISPITPG